MISAAALLADNSSSVVVIAIACAVLVVLTISAAMLVRYFNLWFQAYMSRAEIPFFDLLGMTFRKVNPHVIVRSKIIATQAGLDESEGVTTTALEAHYLAGGNVPLVVQALVAARQAKLDLDFDRLAAIDLTGGDVLETVRAGIAQSAQPVPPVHDEPPRHSPL
jgi:uncharacterized protein YqfA (UPF0365 family)